ncbi:MAG: hypothetical protein KC731_16230 [Myxococcales bacterium]|nr:hypothetical protein [Myxococcales bacterium]
MSPLSTNHDLVAAARLERRWSTIIVLACIETLEPLHHFLGWRRIDVALLRRAARSAWRHRLEEDAGAEAALLERLPESETRSELIRWEAEDFYDAAEDEPYAAAYDAFLTWAAASSHEHLGAEVARDAAALLEGIRSREDGPLRHAIAALAGRVLPLADALVYAYSGFDDDDVHCDTPIRFVQQHAEIRELHAMAASEAPRLRHEEELRSQAERWCQQRRVWLPGPLPPLSRIARCRA